MLSCASFGLVQTKAKTLKPCIEFAYEIYCCGVPRSKKKMCHIMFPFSETVVFFCVRVYVYTKNHAAFVLASKKTSLDLPVFFPLSVLTLKCIKDAVKISIKFQSGFIIAQKLCLLK